MRPTGKTPQQCVRKLSESIGWVRIAHEDSVGDRYSLSLTNEFKIAMALFEIPVSGCTCLRTAIQKLAQHLQPGPSRVPCIQLTFVDVR